MLSIISSASNTATATITTLSMAIIITLSSANTIMELIRARTTKMDTATTVSMTRPRQEEATQEDSFINEPVFMVL